MGPKECIDLTVEALRAGQPVWWHGQPGVGKSECGEEVSRIIGEKEGFECPLWKFPPASALESVDVRGVPFNDNGRTGWLPPKFWPMDPDFRGVVFLDELSQGGMEVTNPFSQAIQSGHIGMDLMLPKGIMWLATGNREEDRAGVKKVGAHLLNRFLHLDFEVSLDDWMRWAMQKGVLPEVRGYLNFKPASLNTFDPKKNERSYCTPRSWWNVSRLFPFLSSHNRYQGVAGLVGTGPAAEFCAFVDIYRDLPDLDEALKTPKTYKIPASNPSVMCALCTALSEKSRTLKDLTPLAEFGSRFPSEYSALCLRDVFAANCTRQSGGGLKADPKIYKGRMMQWLDAHKDVLVNDILKK